MRDYFYNLVTDKKRGFLPNLLKGLLFIFSLIYGLIVRALILLYRLRPCGLSCRVVSVGNITWGGTGKTTVVEYIARYLKQEGQKVAILSRGYKRKVTKSPSHQVTNEETMGDEPLMLSQKLADIPVIVDSNRIRAAKKAIKDYSVDTVILDDGFQQWRIKKDLEIVCIDSTDPFGNSRLIPRGILREPLSALARADLFILTKTNLNPDTQDLKDFLAQKNASSLIIESRHEPLGFYQINQPDKLLSTDILKEGPVTLFCGIADPDSFENLILSRGIKIGLSFRFSDHHNYSQDDLEKIIQDSRAKNIGTIVTTEKDAFRLRQLGLAESGLPIFVLRIALKITKDEQTLHQRLLGLYRL
ncbi:MAG: tetraacyldisaccharide 4'-kinase [Candidatus Omnitrophica bacterium]|nr:tetraacyldisaccharide 4'-kinase [Candidatus Omnitrophota bacterium]